MIARIAVALAVAAACVVAFVATGADEGDNGRSYKVELDNAFGLTQGGDFRVGGVRAGKTTSFGLTEELPARAVVGFEISEPGFDSLRTDAFCQVRQQSLIGEYYLNCQPGSDEEELPAGATIPVDQTGGLVPIDLVQNVLRLPYAERLRLIIAELGTGLAGRPDELSEALQRAHPGLRETSKTLQILGDQTDTLKNFVTDSDTVVAALAKNKTDVSRFVRESAETAEISASRDTELAAGFERLPGFLEQLGPYMGALGEVADETTPLLGDLRSASNDLERFFSDLGPFAEASRPALRTLGEASEVGDRALRNSRDEVVDLRAIAAKAPALGTPLRQFLVSLDDRGRAVERDPRAAATAPPRSDPTGKGTGRGFTGFEALSNYVFWQVLATNGFDEVSHFLRIFGIVDQCMDYNVAPSREQIAQCSTYLGPYQPGIENASGIINGKDFGRADSGNISDFGGRAVNRREGGSPGATGGDKRARRSSAEFDGLPDAAIDAARGKGPRPGLAEPKIVSPGAPNPVEDLTEELLPRENPGQSETDTGGSGQLLDFLLGQ